MSTEENLSQIKGLDKIQAFYDNNKQAVMIAGVALIVVAAGLYYYFNQMVPAKEARATDALFAAESYFKQDSTDKALYGDGEHLGFIDVASQYGSTKAGNLANFYAGRALLDKGEFQLALDHLKKASFDDYFMAASVVALRGDCHSELGDYAAAGKAYMAAADKRANDVTTPRALFKAGLAYDAAGEYSKSLKAFKQIKEDYALLPQFESIDKYIAKMEAKIASAE